jgi:nitrile hydratase
MEGYGRVPYVPEQKAVLTTRWEALAGAAMFALRRAGVTNLDAHRHRIERIDPTRYLPVTYWGRWLAAVESAAVDQGVPDEAEIAERLQAGGHSPEASAPPAMRPALGLESRSNARTFIRHVEAEPRFEAGQRVRTANHAPHGGHHRLPRYCRGRTGRIERVYPAFTFPDTMAHGKGECPTYVYAVGFAATELWGPDADPGQRVHLDLFEPYLLPA